MNGKKILITGAEGVLGSELINNLSFNNIIGLGSKYDVTNSDLMSAKLNQENPAKQVWLVAHEWRKYL